jgi:hypothetical protein
MDAAENGGTSVPAIGMTSAVTATGLTSLRRKRIRLGKALLAGHPAQPKRERQRFRAATVQRHPLESSLNTWKP